MKKKVLLTSILTIALCLSIIAGSTYALFTDKTQFSIAVTAGDIEIEAYAKINAVYSAKASDSDYDEFLIDEKGHTYTHERQENGYFLNGGTATLDGNNLSIVRITPGDRVDVDINVTNKSDVAFVYRYKIIASETNLATGMVVTVDSIAYESLASWTSEWYTAIEAPNGTPATVPVKTISIELPVYAGNEYQSEYTENDKQSVEYTIIVEAVQSNAVTTDESEVIIYYKETPKVAPALDADHFETPTNSIRYKDMYLVGEGNVVIEEGVTTFLENVTANVDGSVIVLKNNPAIFIVDCDFTLDEGEYIVDASAYGTAYQVFLVNVTVNGELLPIGDCDPAIAQYFNNVGWYQVADPDFLS